MTDTLAVIEPATEAVLDEIPRAGVDEVDEAVARAQGGTPGLACDGPGRSGRAAPGLSRAGRSPEELAVLEARNAGKPIGDARGEMGMVAQTFRYYAGRPGAAARVTRSRSPAARRGRCASRWASSG